MEIYQLRSFVSVAHQGNLSRAAEKLFLSQPAVSAHIKALEEEFGVDLFERSSRGMRLTAMGETLVASAEKTLAAAREMLTQARQLTGELSGTIRLGTMSDPFSLRLGEVLGRFSSDYPKVGFQIRGGIGGDVLDAVRADDLDVGYVLGKAEPDGVLVFHQLAEIRLCIAAPAAWKEKIANADWPQLAALPWLATPPRCAFHGIVNDLLKDYPGATMHLVEADQEATLKGLVASGAGLALLREDKALISEAAGEICLWKKNTYCTDLLFVCRKERSQDPALQALLGLVQQVWKAAEPASAVRTSLQLS